MSTIRTPIIEGPLVRLFVCDLSDSLEIEGHMGLVVDCCGRGGNRPNGIIVRPTAGDHLWAPADLDRIVNAVIPRLEAGERVNIHCKSGRSRSTTAAAAVLLVMGKAATPTEAVRMVARNAYKDGIGDAPNRRCTASLDAWWQGRRQVPLLVA